MTEAEQRVAFTSTTERSPGRLDLLIIKQGHCITRVLPETGHISIGRAPGNDVCIEDDDASLHHARLHVTPDLKIEDVGSASGIAVRGARLEPYRAVEIGPNEPIVIGSCTLIVQHHRPATRAQRLWPRGYFDDRVEAECARAARTSGLFAVAHVSLSPSVAPAVVLETLSRELRSFDVIGRDGLSDYQLLLVNMPANAMTTLESRLAASFADRGAVARIGFACYPADGSSGDTLARCARARVCDERAAGSRTSRPPIILAPEMVRIYQLLGKIAASDISVLLLGETGVGKEVLAETIHRQSPRAAKPMLRLSCVTLSESLLESELFGHERGAFTGATKAKRGLLEAANGGTVFLDEVGELSTTIQAKLLRVLEERRVLRVGGLEYRPIDVRFIAATNRDLQAEIVGGGFRSDLYYRLNGVTVVIPPLRARIAEIEPLARHFCRAAAAGCELRFAADAIDTMKRHSWPGNIRELRNVVERAALLCDGSTIRAGDLPIDQMVGPDEVTDPGLRLGRAEVEERRRIIDALDQCAGNQTKAAKLLGVARRTLVYRLALYGIPRPRARARRGV